MVPTLFFYQLGLVALAGGFLRRYWLWPPGSAAWRQPIATAKPPRGKRANAPKAFAGLPPKPPCARCEQAAASPQAPPPWAPDPRPPTHRRPRTVETARHCCPHRGCDDRGWRGLHHLRAPGHPGGGPWRQWHCLGCTGYVSDHHDTMCHGKQAAVALIVRVLACLAEGLGLRATTRGFEGAPNTGLHWRVEAAEHRRAGSRSFLCAVPVIQWPLAEVYAVLREVKAGARSDDEALQRRERSPDWVWTALAPESTWLLVSEGGPRPLAMAQRVVPQVVQGLARGGVPFCWTDGPRDYTRALLAPGGVWVPPERTRECGPAPRPRWMPLPALRYAQGVQS